MKWNTVLKWINVTFKSFNFSQKLYLVTLHAKEISTANFKISRWPVDTDTEADAEGIL